MRRRSVICTLGLAAAAVAALVPMPAMTAVAFAQAGQEVQGFQYFLAVRVEPVEGGLLVEAVMPGGPAELSGIRQGDLIVAPVGGEQFNRVEDLNRVVTASEGRPLPLSIVRDGQPTQITVRAGALLLPSGEVVLPDGQPAPQPEPQAAPEEGPPRPPQLNGPVPPTTLQQPEPEEVKPKQPEVEKPEAKQPESPAPTKEAADRQTLEKELARLRERSKQLEREIAELKAQAAKQKEERKVQPEAKKPAAKKPAGKQSEAKKPEAKKPEAKKPEGKDKPRAKSPGAKQDVPKRDKPREDSKREGKQDRLRDGAAKKQPSEA